MHLPRMERSQIFMGHAITPSSLCKDMDEPYQAGLSPEFDYDDVFGGPPRFMALMSAPHLDRTPTATLEKTTARQFSLRTSSLPVFDLPVFGDNAFSSTVAAKANSDIYDDMFDEEGSVPESSSAFNLRGVPKSKATSLSSSRRISPVHPAVAFVSDSRGDETLVATSLAPILKTRHAAGKFSKRGSISSVSSYNESSGKLGDVSFTSLRNDALILSLPSSPPQSGSFNHFKTSTGMTSGSNNLGALTMSGEVDDVFGGFPKRVYPRCFSAGPQDSRTIRNTPETQRIRALENAELNSINVESRVCSSSSAAATSEISDTRKCTFSRSSSVNSGNNDRDQHDNELMMDRQTDSSVLETLQAYMGKASNIDDHMHLSFQSSCKLPAPRLPSVPKTELKFKCWKDLASDVPASHSPTSRLFIDSVSDATPVAMVTPMKDISESPAKKQCDKNLSPHQSTENLSHTSASGHKGKVKTAEYSIDWEEKELQALLANAWKMSKQMETENYIAKFPEEAPKVSEVKDEEAIWKEQRKHSACQHKSSHIQQCDSVDLDNREDDINWKEWRKYGRRQKKEILRDVGLEDNLSNKDSSLKEQVSVPYLAESLTETIVSRGAAKSWEPLKAATEEAIVDRVLGSFEVSSPPLASSDSQKKFSKGIARESLSAEYPRNEQALGSSDDVEKVASFHNFMSGSSQDFVCHDEQSQLSFCVPVEDAGCLIDLTSSLDGFQEVKGETYECRKSRREKHTCAREHGAKALEEMQHRHAELQCQQDEKHSSEISDGKVKRWAAGKEGNLRALLSNLQHVLWSECGWQPIPLTDLIEVPDVKKAYRKATLFVHPDKVQQKGASIQEKHIAKRVFDILQEAWKTFNLEESF